MGLALRGCVGDVGCRMPDARCQKDEDGGKMDLEAWQSEVTSLEETSLNVASWCFNLKGHN